MIKRMSYDEHTILEDQDYECAYCGKLLPVYTLISAQRHGTYDDADLRPSKRGRLPMREIAGKPRVTFGWQIDHVLPVSRGGTDDRENIVACCRSCNARKRNRTLAEWLAHETSPGRRAELERRRIRQMTREIQRAARDLECDRASAQDLESLFRASVARERARSVKAARQATARRASDPQPAPCVRGWHLRGLPPAAP